jgi:hypothetical protein
MQLLYSLSPCLPSIRIRKGAACAFDCFFGCDGDVLLILADCRRQEQSAVRGKRTHRDLQTAKTLINLAPQSYCEE